MKNNVTKKSKEESRLNILHEYGVLDTPREAEFDAITSMVSNLCGVPIALISLVGEDNVWFKSKVGIRDRKSPRANSFCSEAIKHKDLMIVKDTLEDKRFKTLPIVIQNPKIRFYAAAPLISPNGFVIGTLCIMDKQPRSLTREQKVVLEELSKLVVTQMELHKNVEQLKTTIKGKEYIEKELRESRKQYKQIVDSANELIYRTDKNGFITFFNPAAINLFGYNEKELIGRHYLDLVHQTHRKSIDKFYGIQFLRQTPTSYKEVPVQKKDGNIVWLGQSVHLQFQNEQFTGFSVVARDVTEKKLALDNVAESERRLLTILKTVSEGITLSYENGIFEVFNPRMEEITGYTINEANSAVDFNKLIYNDESELNRVLVARKEITETGRVQKIETVIRSKSGEIKTLSMSSSLMQYGDKKLVLSVYRDITAQKKTEIEIIASEKRFRTFFENNPLPSWIFDLDSLKFIEVNNAAIQHYGYSKNEFIGMTIRDLRSIEDAANLQSSLDQINSTKSSSAQSKHRRKDGSVIDVQVLWSEIEYDNHRAVLVVVQDITRSMQVQEKLEQAKKAAENASKAKSDFLANMSHEIRTPMNGIIGTIGLLQSTSLTAEQIEYVETMRLSSEALLNVINDILDFSKIESNKIELDDHPITIESIIEEAFEVFAIQSDEKGIDLVYRIDENVPEKIMADAIWLRQIIVNLVGNAVKFSEHGEVYVNVKKGQYSNEKVELQFSVQDSGIGIRSDQIEKLFNPFSQIDSSSTRKHGGTGLGLAICARVVSLYGGKIWVDSKINEGSVFHFTINVKQSSESSIGKNKKLPFIQKSVKVLLVDDNLVFRETIEHLLKKWGFLVSPASTVESAIDLVRNGERFDVTMVEHTAPNYSGFILKEAIQKEQGKTEIPSIILSSRTKHDKLSLSENAASKILFKPVRHQVLYDTLVQLLNITTSQKTSVLEKGFVSANLSLPPMRLLIAEDNTINQKLIVRILKNLGQESDVANTGLEAFDAAKQKKYDIVLMDIQMPQMDGYEATRRIRKEIPTENQPFIIAMTAHALHGDKEKCLEAGMDDYLGKPILIDEVRRTLQKWSQIIYESK